MRRWLAMAGVLATMAGSAAGAGGRLLVGGVVHGPEGVRPAAVLLRRGRIAAVVPPGGAAALRSVAGTVVDLHGAHVLPGLIDAHLHLAGYGAALEQVDCAGLTSWDAVASFSEGWCGAVTPGRVADLTILDGDPLAAGGMKVLGLRVLGTIVGGENHFRAGGGS